MSVSINFIVPTLKRPEHLQRCVQAVSEQEGCTPRVLVGVRPDDERSREVIAQYQDAMDLTAVEAVGVGVVGSMNSCLRCCGESYIALVDDDVELPPHWARTMLAHLNAEPDVVASAGRDILMDHPEMRRSEPVVSDVGLVHRCGRITGNHHRGGGEPRRVDILRGSNCLFRADFLKRSGFETSLAGSGAQVNWELALGLQARLEDKKMFFDPTVEVLHHVAPRHDNDTVHRGVFDASGTSDISHNETIVVLKHGRGLTRMMILLWQLVVGSQVCPGAVRVLQAHQTNARPFGRRYLATLRGRVRAVYTLLSGASYAG